MLSRTVRAAHPRFTRSVRFWGKRWETEIRNGKRVDRRSEYVPGRGWVAERAEVGFPFFFFIYHPCVVWLNWVGDKVLINAT